LALALAGPARAAVQGTDVSARAGIEKAQAAIEAAKQPIEGAAAVTRPGSRERALFRAQRELELANSDFELGSYRAAEEHALRAATLAWRSQAPRKGEK
jgi:hypothetical protein